MRPKAGPGSNGETQPVGVAGRTRDTLNAQQRATLRWIELHDPVLHRGYLLKESLLRLIFQLPAGRPPPNSIEWIDWARRCRIPAFVALQKSILVHKPAILAAIEHGLSNGRIESVDSKIRLITRRGFRVPHPRGSHRTGNAQPRGRSTTITRPDQPTNESVEPKKAHGRGAAYGVTIGNARIGASRSREGEQLRRDHPSARSPPVPGRRTGRAAAAWSGSREVDVQLAPWVLGQPSGSAHRSTATGRYVPCGFGEVPVDDDPVLAQAFGPSTRIARVSKSCSIVSARGHAGAEVGDRSGCEPLAQLERARQVEVAPGRVLRAEPELLVDVRASSFLRRRSSDGSANTACLSSSAANRRSPSST